MKMIPWVMEIKLKQAKDKTTAIKNMMAVRYDP